MSRNTETIGQPYVSIKTLFLNLVIIISYDNFWKSYLLQLIEPLVAVSMIID